MRLFPPLSVCYGFAPMLVFAGVCMRVFLISFSLQIFYEIKATRIHPSGIWRSPSSSLSSSSAPPSSFSGSSILCRVILFIYLSFLFIFFLVLLLYAVVDTKVIYLHLTLLLLFLFWLHSNDFALAHLRQVIRFLLIISQRFSGFMYNISEGILISSFCFEKS